MHPIELLDDVHHVEPRYGLFGDSLVLVQCTICTKHTIGSEIILNTPDSTPT
jgi:hypothetical protein